MAHQGSSNSIKNEVDKLIRQYYPKLSDPALVRAVLRWEKMLCLRYYTFR